MVAKPTPGANVDTWGPIVNAALDAIDLATATLNTQIAAMQQLAASLTSQQTAIASRVTALEAGVTVGSGSGGSNGAGTVTIGTAVQYPANAAAPGSATTVAGSVTVAAGVHELLVFVFYGNTSLAPSQVTGVTFGAAALAKITGGTSTSSVTSTGRGVDIWHLTNPTASTATVTATFGASQFGEIVVVPLTSSTGAITFGTTGTDGSAASLVASCTAGTGASKYLGATIARTDKAITVGGGDTALLTPGNTNTTMSVAVVSSTDATLASSWAPTTAGTPQECAAIMVGVSAGSSSSSAPAMPVGNIPGWTQVFTEDFTTDVAKGGFTNASSGSSTLSAPGAYIGKWAAYPTGYNDTSGRGHYDPAKTFSVSGSALHLDMVYDSVAAKYAVSAPVPKLPVMTGGRISSCFRVPHGADTYKFAWLFWPDDGQWPLHGEIDFPECNLTSKIGGFAHYASASGGQDGFSSQTFVNDGAWHVVTTEWVAGSSIKFFLDGVLIGTSTTLVPASPMHFVFQCETNIGGTVNTADTAAVEIDWVVAYQ